MTLNSNFFYNVNCPQVRKKLDKLISMMPSDEPFVDKDGNRNYYRILKYLGYYLQIVMEKGAWEMNQGYLVWNTGLITREWNPIYCVMTETKDGSHSQPYTLVDFFPDGEGEFKFLTNTFTKLPDKPELYSTVEDLHFLPSGSIAVDFTHIINRISRARLPVEFLEKIQDPGCKLKPSDDQYYEELRKHLKKDSFSEMILKSTLERAVRLSLKRASNDPFCAAPSYNPRRKEVCLLLPLSISGDPEAVDCCLVVSTSGEQYAGVTILSLDEAYANARLMGRFSSSWLNNR